MKVFVNGKSMDLTEGWTLAELLRRRGLRFDRVVVEHNGQVVSRGALESTALNDGDRIELVHFVGGG